jgi:DNA-binding LacI/PurR family transcriptional regulator
MTVEPATTRFSESAVSAIVEERIQRGIYAPGSRLPAERTLAEELGVSRRFVRLAYSRLIEQGLLEKSHYRRPSVVFSGSAPRIAPGSAPPLPSGSVASQTIAAVLPSHPTFPGGLSIVAGIHKVLAERESPFRLTFLDTFHADRQEVLKREAKAVQTVRQEGYAGLIWWYYSDEETVLNVLRANPQTATVFIDRHPQNVHCDFAGIDDLESSRLAVEYLLDLHHTRIAHLMDPGNYSTIVERAQGYRAAHTARGLPVVEERIVHLDWAADRMERAFDRLFSLREPPTALFTSNDFIAYEFIKVAEARGVRVPDDLSVVGHGNIDRYAPREFLTTVDQPFELIGRAAAKLLLKRLDGNSAALQTYQHVILQAPLIVRSSSRRLV